MAVASSLFLARAPPGSMTFDSPLDRGADKAQRVPDVSGISYDVDSVSYHAVYADDMDWSMGALLSVLWLTASGCDGTGSTRDHLADILAT